MKTVVIFTANNARILQVEDSDPYKSMSNALVDPDLKGLRGIPPHHWKLVDGKVVEMTPVEKASRDSHIEKHGADNRVRHLPSKKIQRHRPWEHPVFCAGLVLAGLAVGLALSVLIK